MWHEQQLSQESQQEWQPWWAQQPRPRWQGEQEHHEEERRQYERELLQERRESSRAELQRAWQQQLQVPPCPWFERPLARQA